MSIVLGLNCFHADAAAALVRDGRVIAAVEEERFNRIKHSAGFPLEAVQYCLHQGGVDLREVDVIAVGSKPIDHVQEEILQILSGRPNFSRQIQKRLDAVAKFRDVRAILARQLGIPTDEVPRLEEISHPEAHVATAYYSAVLQDAALLSVDGFGDFCSTYLGKGDGDAITLLEAVRFPHSIGILYSMVTQFLGFNRYGDEGKVMGLAALGEPVYRERLLQILQLEEDGLFKLDPSYFTHPVYGMDMIWEDRVPYVEDGFSERMLDVFGPPRHRYADVSVRDKDLAASVQAVLEEALLHLARRLKQLVPDTKNLCYSGVMAQNCVANAKLAEAGLFENVIISSAPTDAGTALGAALVVSRQLGDDPGDPLPSFRLGPAYNNDELQRALEGSGLRFSRSKDIHAEVAGLLAQGKIVGWFRGRLEFGPRALGGRSILADPRRTDMHEALNARVKFRESYRPYAASILAEHQTEWLARDWNSAYMQYAAPILPEKRDEIPAVINRDGTCRYQTVNAEQEPDFHRMISAFHEQTGVPLLLNTSFNENEPIVCTPQDALDCFVGGKIDAVALEDFLIQL